MKLLIAVGGGGHFSPALAVIDQLPKDWEILIVGRKYTFEGDSALSLEYTTANRLNIPFVSLTTGRLQRKLSTRTFVSLLKIPAGGMQAMYILKKFKPDVVLSFGGYVSVPVAAAAALLKIPVVIHEQTLQAGLANKVAAKLAEKICISWKESEAFFPQNKIVLTGNPLRTVFRNHIHYSPHENDAAVPTIYITGGSGGAHGINVLIEECLEKLLASYYIVHQTGDSQKFKDFERLEKKKATLPQDLQKRYMIKKFIDQEDVYHVMSTADLVISRSGINTVTELLYLGKPCLLIPLPFGQHNEQQTNARFVSYIGLGKTVDQRTITAQELFATIQDMVQNVASFKYHATEAHNLIQKDAAEKIIAVVKDVQQKKS